MSEPIYDILKVKDNLGIWHVIPALKGDRGNGIASLQFSLNGTLTITDDDGEVTTYTGITSALAAIGAKQQEIDAAELSRVLAEQTRAGAEEGRQYSETIRQNAESVRNADEALRRNAESARDAAELLRAGAESTRQENEATRQGNENTRQDNEATRESSEAARVAAEEERVSEFNEMYAYAESYFYEDTLILSHGTFTEDVLVL